MKGTLATVAAAFALGVTSAAAADLPSIKAPPAFLPPPLPLWTGFYAGLNLGGGWSINNNNSTNFLPFIDPSFPLGASEPLVGGGFCRTCSSCRATTTTPTTLTASSAAASSATITSLAARS